MQPSDTTPPPLRFGIYPGGAAGTDSDIAVGPPDDAARIVAALDALQAGQPTLLVRCYLAFDGIPGAPSLESGAPGGPFDRYTGRGRRLDLVLSCGDTSGRLDQWTAYVRQAVRRWGPLLDTLQIGEEPNLSHFPGDGRFFPSVVDAVVQGVVAARDELDRLGCACAVGFNSVPSFDPADRFWTGLAHAATPEFLGALGYLGFDFFPDVFRRTAPDGSPGDLVDSVRLVLTRFRETVRAAGIPDAIPMRIVETGWPTGPERSPARQAEVVERVIRTAAAMRGALGLDAITLFSLRDADSSQPDLFRQFGLMRDDYTPKPAFDRYRALIAELGTPAPGAVPVAGEPGRAPRRQRH